MKKLLLILLWTISTPSHSCPERNGSILHSAINHARLPQTLISANNDGPAANNDTEVKKTVWPAAIGTGVVVLFATLIPWLIRSRKKANPREEVAQNGLEDQFRHDLIAYLSQNLENGNLSVKQIATAMKMSRSSLFDKCHQIMGATPLDILRNMRFQKAKELILSGNYSLAQVAFMCGFNDPHYFSKAFKQHFGESPSQFRKHCIQNHSKTPHDTQNVHHSLFRFVGGNHQHGDHARSNRTEESDTNK